MISPESAQNRIAAECRPPEAEAVRLEDAAGRVLREAVAATADSPPFTKAMMDGFAVRAADGGGRLRVVGESAAGEASPPHVGAGTTARIMTGAPLPAGADAVVPVEEAAEDGEFVTLPAANAGRNVLRRGSVTAAGDPIVAAGGPVTPRTVACLAEFGVAELSVSRRARVAYLATGDELVPFAETPGPSQIRNSSEPMLAAQAASWGAEWRPLGIAGDDADALAAAVERGLDADVLLLSGGVSAGKYDLVPGVLAAAGVREVFHKVAVKPGKPLWFGVREAGARRTLVFGLPGNPVSSMVCAEVFVRPAVDRLHGADERDPRTPVRLASDIRQKGNRTTYWPATLAGAVATPLDWRGSADLVSVAHADGWLVLPPGDRAFAAGETLPFHRPAV